MMICLLKMVISCDFLVPYRENHRVSSGIGWPGYGTFPSGRLSLEKWDVVDNDSEIMVFLEPSDDVPQMARKISRRLEADGWPPCTLQTGPDRIQNPKEDV